MPAIFLVKRLWLTTPDQTLKRYFKISDLRSLSHFLMSAIFQAIFQDIFHKVTLSFSDVSDISRKPALAHYFRSNPEAIFQDIFHKVTLSFSDVSDISCKPTFAHHFLSKLEAIFHEIFLRVTLSFSDVSDISRKLVFAHHSRSNPEATIFTYVHYRGIKNLFRRRFYLTGF